MTESGNRSVLLVSAQHGNELLGEKLYEYISNNHPRLLQHVDYYLATLEPDKTQHAILNPT